jgi:hypothetical protein
MLASRRRWLPLATVVCVVVTVVASSHGPRLAATSAEPSPSGASGPREDGAAPSPFREPEPPDGRWLVDDQGREYFIVEVPRREGTYLWVDDARTRVRVVHGIELDVASYDERHIRVKIYRSRSEAAPVVRRPQPTAEERERAAASYRVEVVPGPGVALQPFSAGLPQRGQWRNNFDVADLDGDGHLDIAFGPSRKSRLRVPTIFLGNGAGRWTPWSAARFPALAFDYGDVKAADLNGDGVRDLVVASHLKGIVAMLGDGRGGFRVWSQGIDFWSPDDGRGPAFSSRTVAVVDWNGDGRPDILALGEGPWLARQPGSGGAGSGGSRGAVVYLNQGDGTWTKVDGRRSRNFGGSLAVADFDRDGRLDFVAATDRWGFTALLNLARADGTWSEAPLAALRPEGMSRAVATADFDRDGRPDLAVGFLTREHGTFRAGIDVLFSRATGWERRTLGVVEGRVAVHRLVTGDLDGDGHVDLVGVDGDGALWIFRGDGKGGFTREPAPDLKGGEKCQGYGLRLADLDRDGADEIVVSFAEEPANHGPYGKDLSCPSEGGLQAWKVTRKPQTSGVRHDPASIALDASRRGA